MKDTKATVRLSEEVLRRFKVKLALQSETMQEVLEVAVMDYIKRPKPKI